jgi:hypothetical protein
LQLDIDGHSSSQFVEIDFVVLDLNFPEVWHSSLDDFTEFSDGVIFHVLHDVLVSSVAVLADEVVVLLDQFAKFLVELRCRDGRLGGAGGVWRTWACSLAGDLLL